MARPEVTGKTIFDVTGELLPDPQVARAFNVCSKTIERWAGDERLGFPACVWINGRRYRSVPALKEFVINLIKAGKGGARTAK